MNSNACKSGANEIVGWIRSALLKQKLEGKQLSSEESAKVVSEAMRRFICGNPRAWWMCLKYPAEDYDSLQYKLSEVVKNGSDDVYFIPEIEEDCLPVYELTISQIELVLEDCPIFEYYVVSKKFEWLIAESDHNRFFLVRFLRGS